MAKPEQTGTPKKRRVLKWEQAFITALARQGVVSYACQAAGIGRTTVYRHREQYQDFATAWDEALEVAADALELEARRRAHDGVEEPVFGRVGKDSDGEVGRIRKYSDTLLMFLLKAARPAKFRERVDMNHSGGVDYKIYEKTHEFDPESA
ncbi:MAG: terminase [Chloroflexi bacterium]|nr:terminase [Chloroflexota bacterium]